MDFKELGQLHDETIGEQLTKKADFVLVDRSYNGRREWNRESAWYEVFSFWDMKDRAVVR